MSRVLIRPKTEKSCKKGHDMKWVLARGSGFTDGNLPHGVGAAGLFWLQNPRLPVEFIQDVPELCEGLQNQQELTVELVQSALTKQKCTSQTDINNQVWSLVQINNKPGEQM